MPERNPLRELLERSLDEPENLTMSELVERPQEERGPERDPDWPAQVLLRPRAARA